VAPPTWPSSPGAAIQHTSVIPLGGNHLTNDIAVGLRTPMQEAEKIKVKSGSAQSASLDKDDTIEVPSVGAAHPGCSTAASSARSSSAGGGAVPAGAARDPESGPGRSAGQRPGPDRRHTNLHGMPELPRKCWACPCAAAFPGDRRPHDVVKSPQHATAVGLLLYG